LTAKVENLEKQNQELSKTEQASNDALKDTNSERKQLEQKVH
jgi:prefoldin subunit 5